MTDAASSLSEREMAELAALADGTLPPERREAVEAWVAASPELQELLERQRRGLAATQALAEEPAPESLREAVEARRRVPESRRGRARRLVPRLALAGALAVVVAVVAAVLSGGPGAPTVAEAARVAERAPSGPAPRPLDDGGTQLALDVEGVVFPDLLQSYGWQAVGMRRDEIDGRDATTVFYEKEGRRIAYVIVAGQGLLRPSGSPSTTRDGVRFHTLQLDGRLAVTWRRLGRTCILSGPVPQDELLTLASWRGDGTLRY
jgi:anti-sigma factor RsiW